METLLTKIQRIEAHATRLKEQTEAEGQKTLAALLAREAAVTQDSRLRAELKARDIIREYTEKAKRELNSLQQDETQSVDMIQKTAQQNQAHALTMAEKFLSNILGA